MDVDQRRTTFMGVQSVKNVTPVPSEHQIWNKTPDSRVSKGERTHGGSKHPISQKNNNNNKIPPSMNGDVITQGRLPGMNLKSEAVAIEAPESAAFCRSCRFASSGSQFFSPSLYRTYASLLFTSIILPEYLREILRLSQCES